MKREYLVVFEQGESNWSAFSPDIPGCGSLGGTLEETRNEMRAAMDLCLKETAAAGEAIPEAIAGSVNFEEFDPQREAKQYVVEWLSISLPTMTSQAA